MSRTVRDVLTEHLQGVIEHDDQLGVWVDELLRDLAGVLSTGPGWKTREVPASSLKAGDVILDRRGLLHMTCRVDVEKGLVQVFTRRGDHGAQVVMPAAKPVQVLLTTTDQRALDLLAAELGTELVARDVA